MREKSVGAALNRCPRSVHLGPHRTSVGTLRRRSLAGECDHDRGGWSPARRIQPMKFFTRDWFSGELDDDPYERVIVFASVSAT